MKTVIAHHLKKSAQIFKSLVYIVSKYTWLSQGQGKDEITTQGSGILDYK